MYTPYSHRSVLPDGTTVDWSKDTRWQHSENQGWSLSITAHVTRPDDGHIIVASTKYLDIYKIDGVACQPIPWNTPSGRDSRGKWSRGRKVDEPYKSRFKIKLQQIDQPVESIDKIVLGGHWRFANSVDHFDIPVFKAGRWLEAAPGLRVRGIVHSQVPEDEEVPGDRSNFSVDYDAAVEYEDAYSEAGSTLITVHAVYDDGSTGSAYMRGGTRPGGQSTQEFAFRGGEQGQRITALRVFYAAGWTSEPFRFEVHHLLTPMVSPD